jgi:hypothetical protein
VKLHHGRKISGKPKGTVRSFTEEQRCAQKGPLLHGQWLGARESLLIIGDLSLLFSVASFPSTPPRDLNSSLKLYQL